MHKVEKTCNVENVSSSSALDKARLGFWVASDALSCWTNIEGCREVMTKDGSPKNMVSNRVTGFTLNHQDLRQ